MKCSVCLTELVEDHIANVEDVMHEVYSTMLYKCPDPFCAANAVGSQWDSYGDYYCQKYPYIVAFIGNVYEAYDSPARRTHMEVYVHPQIEIFYSPWLKLELVKHVREADTLGHVIRYRWGINTLVKSGHSWTYHQYGVSMVRYYLRQCKHFKNNVVELEKIRDRRMSWGGRKEWWRSVGEFIADWYLTKATLRG